MSNWVNRNPFLVLGGLLGLWFAVFCIAFNTSSGRAQVIPPLVPPSEYDRRLLELDREAIDAAYHEQVKLLFKNWMNDPNVKQPGRAITGLRNAARAYIEAMDGAKKREQELKAR